MSCIKLSTLIVICIALATGCTSASFQYKDIKGSHTSFLQPLYIECGCDEQGNPYVIYDRDGGGEQAGKVIGSAVKAAAK